MPKGMGYGKKKNGGMKKPSGIKTATKRASRR